MCNQIRMVFAFFLLGVGQYLSAAPASLPNTDSVLRHDLIAKARAFQHEGYRARAIVLL